VLSGVGGAALLTGVIVGALALSAQSEFDDGVSSGLARDELQDIGDSAESRALIADISFGLAAAAVITAVVLFVVHYVRRRNASQRQGARYSLMPTPFAAGGEQPFVGR